MKILKNYIYNVGYNLLTIILPIFTMPYVTGILSPKSIGINTATNATITYFLLAGSLGINIYGSREIAANRDDQKKTSQIFWEIEFLQFITITISVGCFIVFLSFQKQYQNYLLIQSVALIAGLFDISWFFMGLEDFKKTVLRNFMVKIGSAILIFTLIKDKNDLGLYIAILSFSQLVGNVTMWPYLRKLVDFPEIKNLRIFRHLRPAISLFIPQVAIMIYLTVNKTMIWKIDSVTASGFYDYTDKIIKITLAVVTSLGVVLLPRMTNLFSKNEHEEIERYLKYSATAMLCISIAITMGIAAVGQTFVNCFFKPAYHEIGILMIIEAPVVVLIAMSNLIGRQFLIPTRRNKEFTLSVTYGAISNIILNVPAIMLWGVRGAMAATVVAEFVVTYYQIMVYRKTMSARKLFEGSWKYLVAAVIMFIPTFYLSNQLESGYRNYRNLLIEIMVGMVIYITANIILRTPAVKIFREFVQNNLKNKIRGK
ncbi:MAG: polysaccharide biosynthesis C-terminal domain-containing protein [Liquorilactobacillus hordei]|uniref:oligosaccharide flippase family protein n=1 Tax=Liquorilactobacillus hordei TaxID=468911 RepID=UPI0039E8843C